MNRTIIIIIAGALVVLLAVVAVVGIPHLRSNPVSMEEQVLNQLRTDAEKAEAFAAAVHGRANTLRDGANAVINDMKGWYKPRPASALPRQCRTRDDLEQRVGRLECQVNNLGGSVIQLQSDMGDVKKANQSVAKSIQELTTAIRARTYHHPPGRGTR
jgi:hypothetical protein